MKFLLPSLLLISALGAGCTPAPATPSPSNKTPEAVVPVVNTDPKCATAAIEDESGAMRYPLLDTYAKLPHLGQIYSALDCGHSEWVSKIHGVSDKAYRLGVHLAIPSGGLAEEDQAFLTSLGFTENKDGSWQTDKPLAIDQLLKLKPLLLQISTSSDLPVEDCVLCG
ncbi:MAG: hypothetical protein ABIO72_03475 [Patescibacteria group bacterium]